MIILNKKWFYLCMFVCIHFLHVYVQIQNSNTALTKVNVHL